MFYSLVISIFIVTLAFISTSYASSGDITIGTKTYTQSEAQKQIVEPLLKRLEKQKIAKTKLRLINFTIRQYTNKQKIAQKQGKIDLVNFYGTIITILKGEVSKIPVISISTTNNISSQNKPKQNTTTTMTGSVNNHGGSLINNTNVITGQNGTAEQKARYLIEKDVIDLYNNGSNGANQSKALFIALVTEQYGSNTYAVEYAKTLKFNDTISASGTTSSSKGSTVNNTDGVGTAGSYNGTSGMTQQQIEQRLIENDVFTIYVGQGGVNQSKASFIEDVVHNYGANTYAIQYANTLKFNQP